MQAFVFYINGISLAIFVANFFPLAICLGGLSTLGHIDLPHFFKYAKVACTIFNPSLNHEHLDSFQYVAAIT